MAKGGKARARNASNTIRRSSNAPGPRRTPRPGTLRWARGSAAARQSSGGGGGGGFEEAGGGGGAGSIYSSPYYEAASRSANDALSAALAELLVKEQLIGPEADVARQRINTDLPYAIQGVNENMAERGIFNSTVRPYTMLRDVFIPVERGRQDIAFDVAGRLSDIAAARAQAYLGYDQTMSEAALEAANQLAQQAGSAMGENVSASQFMPSGPTDYGGTGRRGQFPKRQRQKKRKNNRGK